MTSTEVSSSSQSVEAVFQEFVDHLHDEHQLREDIREKLRDLEKTTRELDAMIQKIHQPTMIKKLPEIVKLCRDLFEKKVKAEMAEFKASLPETDSAAENQYYRFHGMFRETMQRLAFSAAMTKYLDTEALVTREEVAKEFLGIVVNSKEGFHLDLEDYLTGLILMSNELARLSVNSVTSGDLDRPVRILAFLNDLRDGFRLLNLKNDQLRKRYDGLKYDLKKVEEVVYNLAIRGLNKNSEEVPRDK